MIPSAVWVDANFYSHQSHFTPTQFFPNLSNISSKMIEKRDILNQLFLSTLMTNEKLIYCPNNFQMKLKLF